PRIPYTTLFRSIFAINASSLIIGSYLNGILTKYMYYIKIANIASVVLSSITVVILIVLFTVDNFPYQWVVIGLYLTLFTVGFINPNATAASLSPFKGNVGIASALGGAIRMGVGAVVAATIGVFQTNSSATMFVTICGLAVLSMLMLWMVRKKTT